MKRIIQSIHKKYRIYRNKKKWRKPIAHLLDKSNLTRNLSKKQVGEINSFWTKYYKSKSIDTIYHQLYYTLNNNFSPLYVPLDFHVLNVKSFFNRTELINGYDDKNQYELFFPEIKQPKTILKNMNGLYFVNGNEITKQQAVKLCSNLEEVIIKPSINSGKGNKVVKFTSVNSVVEHNGYSLSQFLEGYDKDYIIQEAVKQHKAISDLNKSSLNTIRCMTLRCKNEILVLGSSIRVGAPGSFIDNANAGGMFCGINDDGTLQNVAYSLNPIKRYDGEFNGLSLKSRSIPSYNKIKKAAILLHQKLPYFHLIAWDFAVDSEGEVVLIEMNIKDPGIHTIQVPHGPLFGNRTKEILNLISKDIQKDETLYKK